MLAAIRTLAEGHVFAGPIRLSVNGAVEQDSDIRDLKGDCAETIASVSRIEPIIAQVAGGEVSEPAVIVVAIAALWPHQQHVDPSPRGHFVKDLKRHQWRD